MERRNERESEGVSNRGRRGERWKGGTRERVKA